MREAMKRFRMAQNGSRGGYVPVVDYLKAICIVLVIFNHTGVFNISKPFFIMAIDAAVPVFMILSGYVMGLSVGGKSMAQMYEGKRLSRKLLRYIVPLFLTFFLFVGLKAAKYGGVNADLCREIARQFIYFEYGPGAYYFALMLEFLFLSPLMLWTIRRFDFRGVMLFGAIDFSYEICSVAYAMDDKIYRILVFRYLFAIALGMDIGLNRDKEIKNEYLIASFAVGLVYKLIPSFCGYQYRFFAEPTWAETSMISVMYVFPIVYLILYYGHDHMGAGKLGGVTALIGRASYHIMCTQMIYFCVSPSFIDISAISTSGKAAVVLLDTVVSVLSGIVFYYIDDRVLTGWLVRRIARPRRNKEIVG